nr:MAG TPA: hypothetical protein [Crassvirales sp.]
MKKILKTMVGYNGTLLEKERMVILSMEIVKYRLILSGLISLEENIS